MKNLAIVSFALSALIFAGAIFAGDEAGSVTLEGNVVCAKCGLHEEGRDECQNVLVVEAGDATENYYLAKTDANDEFGEVCVARKPVRVTGTVTEKDGKKWLAATEITPIESES